MKKFYAVLLILVTLLVCFTSCSAESDGERGVLYSSEKSSSYLTLESSSDSSISTSETESMIAYSATVNAKTKEFETAIDQLRVHIESIGGYVSYSKIQFSGYYGNERTATMTLAVPAKEYDAFFSYLSSLVTITSSSESQEDYTSEYVDYSARLSAMQAEEDAIRLLLEKATTIDEVLKVQDRLYEVIAEREAYQAKINTIQTKVDYAHISFYLDEEVEKEEPEEESFFTRIADAFAESWAAFAEGWLDFAVFIVAAFPTLLILAVIAVVVILIIKRIIRKKKNK